MSRLYAFHSEHDLDASAPDVFDLTGWTRCVVQANAFGSLLYDQKAILTKPGFGRLATVAAPGDQPGPWSRTRPAADAAHG